MARASIPIRRVAIGRHSSHARTRASADKTGPLLGFWEFLTAAWDHALLPQVSVTNVASTNRARVATSLMLSRHCL